MLGLVKPAVDHVLPVGCALVVLRSPGRRDEPCRLEVRIDQHDPVLRCVTRAIERQAMQLAARVKVEGGAEGGKTARRFRLLHLRQQMPANRRRPQVVTVNVQHPQRRGRHIGPPKRSGHERR